MILALKFFYTSNYSLVTKLSADNRLPYETLRCVTKLTSLATSACLLDVSCDQHCYVK